MIIIPDIHGRIFWKDAVKEKVPGEEVVFLGDYLDPYPGEKNETDSSAITKRSAIENFKEIIEYKKQNPSEVILLLGNHDTEYFLGTQACREDFMGWEQIQAIFEKNLRLFNVAAYKELPEITYTFSHSGILKGWVDNNLPGFDNIIEVIDHLNGLLHGDDDSRTTLGKLLSPIGWARGGNYMYGSPIWSDLYEIPNNDWPGVFQIFGHSQQYQYPIHETTFSMLDCRMAFRLNPGEESVFPLPCPRILKDHNNIKAYARKKDQI